MSAIVLLVEDGELVFSDTNGETALVLYVYDAGDCDTFKWPLDITYRSREKQLDQIVAAIYGDRECGLVRSDVDTIILPDNTELKF